MGIAGHACGVKDKTTVIRDKRIMLCRRLPLRQRDGCEKWANETWQMQGSLIDNADKRGQEASLKPLWQNAAKMKPKLPQ